MALSAPLFEYSVVFLASPLWRNKRYLNLGVCLKREVIIFKTSCSFHIKSRNLKFKLFCWMHLFKKKTSSFDVIRKELTVIYIDQNQPFKFIIWCWSDSRLFISWFFIYNHTCLKKNPFIDKMTMRFWTAVIDLFFRYDAIQELAF